MRRTPNKVILYINWILIAFIIVYTIVSYFITIFQCTPIDAAWNDLIRYINVDAAPCLDHTIAFFMPSLVATITDFFVAAVPILFLRQLHLPKRQKWTLVLVFSLGFMYGRSHLD